MKVPSSSRSRSGLAWASCSSSRRAGSILGLTVIVVSFFESVLADHSKDHAVAVAYAGDTLTEGAVHHSTGRNSRRAGLRGSLRSHLSHRVSTSAVAEV